MLARLSRVVLVLSLVASFIGATPGASAAGQNTVHVKAYTKKDGTHVDAYDRKAPESHATAKPAATPPATAETPAATATPSLASIARDEQGRIQRSAAARHAFARQTGFPNGRPGWIIDHVVPLACGGVDAPSNMQWQTVAAAKAKDRLERVGC